MRMQALESLLQEIKVQDYFWMKSLHLRRLSFPLPGASAISGILTGNSLQMNQTYAYSMLTTHVIRRQLIISIQEKLKWPNDIETSFAPFTLETSKKKKKSVPGIWGQINPHSCLVTAQMCVGWKKGKEGKESCKETVKCLHHLPGFSRREGCASEQLEASSEVRILPSRGRGAI